MIAHEEAVIHSVMHALSLDQEPQPYTHALSL